MIELNKKMNSKLTLNAIVETTIKVVLTSAILLLVSIHSNIITAIHPITNNVFKN